MSEYVLNFYLPPAPPKPPAAGQPPRYGTGTDLKRARRTAELLARIGP